MAQLERHEEVRGVLKREVKPNDAGVPLRPVQQVALRFGGQRLALAYKVLFVHHLERKLRACDPGVRARAVEGWSDACSRGVPRTLKSQRLQ